MGRAQPGQRAEVPRAQQGALEAELTHLPTTTNGVRAKQCPTAPPGNQVCGLGDPEPATDVSCTHTNVAAAALGRRE